MATFAKKEKEKKKAKKKQDKAQKREERKVVNNKGKTLDDMIMYIDENGNLSKTPIDMSQRREIDPDTIQLGATAMPDPDEEFTGIVSFISDKGYGFIVEDGSQANSDRRPKEGRECTTNHWRKHLRGLLHLAHHP